jgi:kumamolisin
VSDIPKGFVPVAGSYLAPVKGYLVTVEAIEDELEAIVVLRRQTTIQAPAAPASAKGSRDPGRPALMRADFVKFYGASETDLQRVATYANEAGLTIVEQWTSLATRALALKGPFTKFEAAFAVKLAVYKSDAGDCYVGRNGPVFVPTALTGIVEAVLGLDTRQVGFRCTRILGNVRANLPKPPDVAKQYNFLDVTVKNQCIALLEFGGGYYQADIDAYFKALQRASPNIVEVDISGQSNNPGIDQTCDKEVTMDVCIAGSVAQGATLALYFSRLTELGWYRAVSACLADTKNDPSVISISWGAPELGQSKSWSSGGMAAMSKLFQDAARLNITVVAAAGDYGSDCLAGDRMAHVEYPASDPSVIGCGGTVIANFAQAPAVEVPWTHSVSANGVTASGGGISDIYPVPAFQRTVSLPDSVNTGQTNRGVPDIAGYAAPAFAFVYNGQAFEAAGTSLVAPLYAALFAQLNASLGKPIGFITDKLYSFAGTTVFRDMTGGLSNSVNYAAGYRAGAGWDAVTGLGVIDGKALLVKL